ncbi:MAG: CHC2 zinc finger domain-containing protein [Marmoricola sp.]
MSGCTSDWSSGRRLHGRDRADPRRRHCYGAGAGPDRRCRVCICDLAPGRRRARSKGLCPFHDEKSPSFNVTPSRQMYYCFGCGQGGDVIKFVMEMDGLGFTETVERLAEKFGVTLRYEEGGAPRQHSGPARQRLVEAHRVGAGLSMPICCQALIAQSSASVPQRTTL